MNENGYNYIWYPLTSFVEIPKDKIKYCISEVLSPHMELNLESINRFKKTMESTEIEDIEINPFIRFTDIFYLLFSPDRYEDDKKIKDSIFNILVHFLGELDLYLGQNKKDIIMKEMIKTIEKGAFGEKIKEDFKVFKEYEKVIIVDGLYSMYNYTNMLEVFKRVFKAIFSDSIIYDNLSSETNIIIYLNYEKTEENILKVTFIKEMFLPLNLESDLFWEKHFGVVGVDVTMRIGEISIF